MRVWARRALCTVLLFAAVACTARAQIHSTRLALESRADVFVARTTALHAAAGVNVIAGTYVRIGVVAGGGARRIDSVWRSSGRVDVVARFHVDPFGESRWGGYAGGGASYFFDRGVPGRARAVIVIGFEGRSTTRRWVPGVELGLGGGARIGVTLRRARAARR
jgi:hypothetical protein